MEVVLTGGRRTGRVEERGQRSGCVPALLALYPLALLALAALNFLREGATGLLALSRVFNLYLYVPLLLLLPFLFRRGAGPLRLLLAAALLPLAIQLLPQLGPGPQSETAGAPGVSLLTWNRFAGNEAVEPSKEMVLRAGADVVAFQESDWRWLADDSELAERYPHRLLHPNEVPPGMVLLSRYPVLEYGQVDGPRDLWDIPRILWARLDIGGQPLTVMNAHPIAPATFGRGCSLPACYNPAMRDRQIAALRSFVAERVRAGERVLMAGDFNVTEREQAYRELTADLADAHRSAGVGLGHTWRPWTFARFDLAVLRIDYILAGQSVRPLALNVDCSVSDSDHCALLGKFELR